MAELAGQTIGSWHLKRLLGSGERGEVYLAEQLGATTQAALRVAQLAVQHPSLASGSSPASRFSQEAQRLVALKHGSVLSLLEYGQQNQRGYLVMSYLPDGSLLEAFSPGTPKFRFALPLQPATVAGLLDQVAGALGYLHGQGVLHGNVKPSNMLLASDAQGALHVLVSDFGLSSLFMSTPSQVMSNHSALYAAPELLQGQPVPASDQYSLGIVVYQLLTGHVPFGGSDLAQVIQQQLALPPPPPRNSNPSIPQTVEQVLFRALAKDPAARWPSVAAFAAAYREALAGYAGTRQPQDDSASLGSAGQKPASVGLKPQIGGPVQAARPVPVPLAAPFVMPPAQQVPQTPQQIAQQALKQAPQPLAPPPPAQQFPQPPVSSAPNSPPFAMSGLETQTAPVVQPFQPAPGSAPAPVLAPIAQAPWAGTPQAAPQGWNTAAGGQGWSAPPGGEWGQQPPSARASGFQSPPVSYPEGAPGNPPAPSRSRRLALLGGGGVVALVLVVTLVVVLVGGTKNASTANGNRPTSPPAGAATATPRATFGSQGTPSGGSTPGGSGGQQMIMTDQFVTAIATTTAVSGNGPCDYTFPSSSALRFRAGDQVMIVYTANLAADQLDLFINIDRVDSSGVAIDNYTPGATPPCAGRHTYVLAFDTGGKSSGTYKAEILCLACGSTGPDATIFFEVQ
jgi:serine/threonine protein kinase